MKHILVVVADTNDGDYITQLTEVTPEMLEELIPVFVAISNRPRSGNWPRHECVDQKVEDLYEGILTPEQIENFNDYIPYGEAGTHTIKSVNVLNVESERIYVC